MTVKQKGQKNEVKIDLTGKIALITGAGRGIGKAIALRFAQAGAKIALNDINLDNLEKAMQEIKQLGGEGIYIKADVSKRQEVKNMVEYIERELGVVDILVNNAAITKIVPFLETTEELWNRTLDINLKGAFLCAKAVIPGMIKKRGGKIINMSSQSGQRGSPWHIAYSVSKFGIIGLTQCLAVEFGRYNIKVNAICPGVVWTPAWEETVEDYAERLGVTVEEAKKHLVSKIPLGRLGKVEDIADAALFLASSLSDYITGQAISLSGGSVL